MKTNDRKELHKKTVDDLMKSLSEKQNELSESRLSHTRGKLKNPRILRALRRDIAQIASILRGKELANGKNA